MNKKGLRIIGIAAVLGGAGYVGARLLIPRLSPRPDTLGADDGKLSPCPSYPACVSSQAPLEDEAHAIAPLSYTGTQEEARARILEILQGMERTTVITAADDYLYAEVVSPGFGYIDDVEFTFDDHLKLIHFRSSARVPYYDFQVNRKRMEAIRTAFLQAE
ncbi:MAG: DUF1499 domain-containing protein [Anaerolineae bacterium]|nr:DUF1499 domain-containing protein [Anaerolineae bacterium]